MPLVVECGLWRGSAANALEKIMIMKMATSSWQQRFVRSFCRDQPYYLVIVNGVKTCEITMQKRLIISS